MLLRDGFAYVFRVERRQQGQRRPRSTIGRRLGDRIEIIGGLPPTARVVATGGGFLADGDTVRVVEASRQPPVQVGSQK